MAYIGKTPVIGNFQVCDAITVVDAQAAYTMQVGGVNVSPESANHMLVSLNGILQAPTSSFTVSGSTITFASALETGDVIDFIQILGNVLDLGVPSDNTVTTAKIADGAITSAKLDAGKVLNVVQTVFTGAKSTTSTSLTDVSGASVSITPISTSNKILVLVNANDVQKNNADVYGTIVLLRGSTEIAQLGGQIGFTGSANYNNVGSVSGTYLDSPATISSTTYKLQFKTSGGTFLINTNSGTESMITVMEISA
jgi:hypothetical protein